MLEVSGLHASYGHVAALRGVDLLVGPGEIVSLIGANGAGKSTLLMAICGDPPPTAGRVMFEGDDITRLATHRIARRGIIQVPEGRRIFSGMTVEENLQTGGFATTGRGTAGAAAFDRVYGLFPRLAERRRQRAGTLSGGEQQMLAIGRALMGAPRLLMLDEPSLGLAPLLVQQIFQAIAAINRSDGTTVLLVEQNAHQALALAHRGYVMVQGQIALTGSGAELLRNPAVQAAYLDGAVGGTV